MDSATMQRGIDELAARWVAERPARQARRHLERVDFDDLAATGYLLTGVPADRGGLFRGIAASSRPTCEALRALAAGDPSVALVSAMHPAVLSYWATMPDEIARGDQAWAAQCEAVFASALDGGWWGTITSEPGSGGDISRTRATARRDDGGYRLSGQKHFGSGSGITSFMVTTAVADGDEEADWFYLDVRDVEWGTTPGIELVAPWDGRGMAATQSHALSFSDFPATRIACAGHLADVAAVAGPYIAALFTAVVVGVVDTAIDLARAQLDAKRDTMRAFERVEWARAESEGWLIDQAYEGMLRALESGAPRGATLRAKTAIAEHAESCLLRICRVVGGGTFSQRSPFGAWFEDVRALGFLRPPWGLAYDGLFEASFESPR
jgi:alkylation response protein AidB-like acyl-CoA dehydrogenase